MFDTRLHGYFQPSDTVQSRALIDRMRASWRSEAQAAADRLDAIGELFEVRRAESGECADWAVDTWAAVGAEVAAAFRISLAMAGSYLRYALAMRERLPGVAEVFRAGDIDYRLLSRHLRCALTSKDQAASECCAGSYPTVGYVAPRAIISAADKIDSLHS